MDAPEKNISSVIFGTYEIDAWYYSPYVLDGLVRPEDASPKPLRLNGGFSGAGTQDDEDGDMTDSTDVDDSMQHLPEASTSSRPPSPRVPHRTQRPNRTSVAGPSAARPAALRREAKSRQGSSRPRSPVSKNTEEHPASSAAGKSRKDKVAQSPIKLYVCEGCFKYMVHPASYAIHMRACKMKGPPGRKVYQKGASTIWEVDGEAQKLYCQNLCLFGKLFIDHKYVFFETSGFLFYVLTEARPSFDHTFGFFSKEKISYNDYNLACIVTFPPFQKRGYGTLMIEFSYELSSRSLYSRRAGTPERPLSDLGLRGYLQFWTSVLVRYFRLIFYTRNDPRLAVSTEAVIISRPKYRKKVRGFQGEIMPETAGSLVVPGTRTSPIKKLSVSPEPSLSQAAESATGPQTSGIPPSQDEAMDVVQDAVEAKPEQVEDEPFEMQFSLAEIANATDLREDDVAFTLVHSGLANFRTPLVRDQVAAPLDSGRKTPDPECSSSGIEEMQIVLTSAIVEDIATKFKVKPPVLSKAHCLF